LAFTHMHLKKRRQEMLLNLGRKKHQPWLNKHAIEINAAPMEQAKYAY
jgi:hypothetical protein